VLGSVKSGSVKNRMARLDNDRRVFAELQESRYYQMAGFG